ncbi:MAG: hypothetical protein H6658_04680 [Ardenticatenaceae bacterium]|nr:hypothetical protein [Ardenticatenaceae bacterium]
MHFTNAFAPRRLALIANGGRDRRETRCWLAMAVNPACPAPTGRVLLIPDSGVVNGRVGAGNSESK